MEAPPTYINFKGNDGLKLDISLPSIGPFDYTLMFWFRSNKSYEELSEDSSIKNGKKAFLFEIPGFSNGKYKSADTDSGAACYITIQDDNVGPILSCSTDDENEANFMIDLNSLPDIK